MDEIAITVKDLVIRYRKLQNYSIRNQLLSIGKKKDDSSKYFEAISGISFEVKKGEILGIIGKNGSGKSTLLRALAGIFSPNEGTIDLHGHDISLLAIGVGFQKELTGRQNINLSGMLLGFTEEQIREKTDEIIEFSELGDFIDMPVKTYSSGMHSKLAFSITAILETDIILVDEVLSVGDEYFKKKSYAKMKELISDQNRTVVIVSHSMASLLDLCTSVLWVHKGKVRRMGDPEQVIGEYRAYMDKIAEKKAAKKAAKMAALDAEIAKKEAEREARKRVQAAKDAEAKRQAEAEAELEAEEEALREAETEAQNYMMSAESSADEAKYEP